MSEYTFVYQEWDVMRERQIQNEEKMERTPPSVSRSATFSIRLQEARIAKRITVADLATKVGVSSRTMTLYENGTEMPPAEICAAISHILNMNPDGSN